MKIKIVFYPILLPIVLLLRIVFVWIFYNYKNTAEIKVLSYLVNNTVRVDLYGVYFKDGCYKLRETTLDKKVTKFSYYLNLFIWIWYDSFEYDSLINPNKLLKELTKKELEMASKGSRKKLSYEDIGLGILVKAVLNSKPNNFIRLFKGSSRKLTIFNIGYKEEKIINGSPIYLLRYF